MNIMMWNKSYWMRRFSEIKNVGGYLTRQKEDTIISIHIETTGSNSMQPAPEGERLVKRLNGQGMVELHSSDQAKGEMGDLVWYRGEWYECTSSVFFHDTILTHWNYTFTVVPSDAHTTFDLSAPAESSEVWSG